MVIGVDDVLVSDAVFACAREDDGIHVVNLP
jgi:hypothetical protein